MNLVGVDPPELKGCEHEWTRWMQTRARGTIVEVGDLPFPSSANLVGEFCERCGQVRMYRPDPEDEAA